MGGMASRFAGASPSLFAGVAEWISVKSFLFVGVFGVVRISVFGLWVQRVCGAGRACCGGSWRKREAQGAVGVPMLAVWGV